jgi:hypothetical protein
MVQCTINRGEKVCAGVFRGNEEVSKRRGEFRGSKLFLRGYYNDTR